MFVVMLFSTTILLTYFCARRVLISSVIFKEPVIFAYEDLCLAPVFCSFLRLDLPTDCCATCLLEVELIFSSLGSEALVGGGIVSLLSSTHSSCFY